jgi:hypothetical protein
MPVLVLPPLSRRGALSFQARVTRIVVGANKVEMKLRLSRPSYHLSSYHLRLDSSGKEAPSDYSVEKGCHKLNLIATIP